MEWHIMLNNTEKGRNMSKYTVHKHKTTEKHQQTVNLDFPPQKISLFSWACMITEL